MSYFMPTFLENLLIEAILLHELKYQKGLNVSNFILNRAKICLTSTCKGIFYNKLELTSPNNNILKPDINSISLYQKLQLISDLIFQKNNIVQINIKKQIRNRNILFLTNKKNTISAIKILNIERYNSILPLRVGITAKISKNIYYWIILSLYNSYVFDSSQGEWIYLLFDSTELSSILTKNDYLDLSYKYFQIKSEVIKHLNNILSSIGRIELELIILTLLQIKIIELLNKYNLDKISFNLYIIKWSARDISLLKVIRLIFYANPRFLEILKSITKSSNNFLMVVSNILSNKDIMKRLPNPNRKTQYEESDNLLRALYGLYNFITCCNVNGLYQFVREIKNCYEKTNSSQCKAQYKRILEELKWCL